MVAVVVPSPADVGGLAGDFADHAGAHVFKLVRQLDLAGDGHAVLGDGRGAEALFQNHVPPPRPEGDADGTGQLADPATHRLLGLLIEGNHLRHGIRSPRFGAVCAVRCVV